MLLVIYYLKAMRTKHLAVALAVATTAIASACLSTSPTAAFTGLSILGQEALRAGESVQFRAMGVRKDGSEEEVLAQWANSTVLGVSRRGDVTVGFFGGRSVHCAFG